MPKYLTIGECMDATKGEAYIIFYRSLLREPVSLNCGLMNVERFRENCSSRDTVSSYLDWRPCSFHEYLNHKLPFGFHWPSWKKNRDPLTYI